MATPVDSFTGSLNLMMAKFEVLVLQTGLMMGLVGLWVNCFWAI
ncbi:MAG TPA: hypothetical protein VK737_09635 [Opitutales bacterium]|jgi:hypothetical protein|nr:hypothetical protein [Opitutales bacterium]